MSKDGIAADNYKLEVKTPTEARKGQPAVVRVHVEGTNGYFVNIDYPMSLAITPPAGVTVTKAQQFHRDAVMLKPSGMDFDITFTSADAGKKVFTGNFKFAVATTKDATLVTTKIEFSVDVK
ncbi:hypothetical protein [Hyalangium sp.]|uniref:hypothetical protein n=1 Tax=Hyalangium sp. TaxID=2028555 RepID=UPI002D751BBA|nr:hypothetical protein [Hyalangium sp.]HYI02943.1 hypothetical protein [Hyalangium sp.]